jgi:hypothetical protein
MWYNWAKTTSFLEIYDNLKRLEWKWQSNEPRHFHRIANGHLMCKNGWVCGIHWQAHQRWELASYGKQMIPKKKLPQNHQTDQVLPLMCVEEGLNPSLQIDNGGILL